MLLPFSTVAIGLMLSLANFLSPRQFISFSPFILGIIVDKCLDLVEKKSHLKERINALREETAAKANEEIVRSPPEAVEEHIHAGSESSGKAIPQAPIDDRAT